MRSTLSCLQLAVKALGDPLPNAGLPPGSLRAIAKGLAEFFRVKAEFLDRIANTYPKLKFEVVDIKEVRLFLGLSLNFACR